MTRRFQIEGMGYDLDVRTDATDEEMDGTFTAVCLDTGETLNINGWLIESSEQIPDDERLPA